MAANPDNFIFHSDFWYPTNYISGYQTYTNIDIPATLQLSNKYEAGDFYTVIQEYNSPNTSEPGVKYISYRQVGDTFFAFTQGNDLKAFKGAQSVGAKFTGKIHYRIYKKPKNFNFLSKGKLEKILRTEEGTVNFDYSMASKAIVLPETDLMYFRGIWRVNNGPWSGFNTAGSTDGFATANIRVDASGVQTLNISLFGNSNSTGNVLEYKLVGIKLYD